MLAFERLELAHQRVVLSVGDLGIVENVVAVVVMIDLLAKLFGFALKLLKVVSHRLGKRLKLARLQKGSELVHSEAGLSNYSSQRSLGDLAMIRNHKTA